MEALFAMVGITALAVQISMWAFMPILAIGAIFGWCLFTDLLRIGFGNKKYLGSNYTILIESVGTLALIAAIVYFMFGAPTLVHVFTRIGLYLAIGMVYAIVAYITELRSIYKQMHVLVQDEAIGVEMSAQQFRTLLSQVNTNLSLYYAKFPVQAKDHTGILSVWFIAWPFDLIGRFFNPLEWLLTLTNAISVWATNRWMSEDVKTVLKNVKDK